MNIGRKELTENEFNIQWYKIYKELCSLYDTQSCNVQVVYDAMFALCTSAPHIDNRLYWKIGDVMYSKCLLVLEAIENGADMVVAYNKNFTRYKEFCHRVDEVCCFLNDCVKGKTVGFLGFLLWEKSVIQKLGEDFFNKIYEYKNIQGNDRIRAIESFRYIVLMDNEPLLYYVEKYEKIGITNITKKYQHTSKITGLLEFSDTMWNSLVFEIENFNMYFLPESAENVQKTLEETFYTKPEIIALAYKTLLNQMVNSSVITEINMPETVHDIYKDEIIEQLKYLIEKPDCNQILLKKHSWFFTTTPDEFAHFKVFEQIGSLNTGLKAIKQGYALFVYETLSRNQDVLTGPVESIYQLFNKLNLFDFQNICEKIPSKQKALYLDTWFKRCTTMSAILEQILKRYLERVKPSYINRLAQYTNQIAVVPRDEKPFATKSKPDYEMFKMLFTLVSNKKEFTNVYKEILTQRILNKNSLINNEIELLNFMTLEEQNKLSEMVTDLNNETEHIRILNNSLWNFVCENENLGLNQRMLDLIARELPGFKYKQKEDKRTYEYDDTKTNTTRTITFAHQFTRVYVKISNRLFFLSIYQYLVLDLINKGVSISNITKQINLNKTKIGILVDNLEKHGILVRAGNGYKISHTPANESTESLYTTSNHFKINADTKGEICIKNQREFSNISKVDLDFSYNREYDKVSQLLTTIARILKKEKHVARCDLRAKVMHVVQDKIDDSEYSAAMKQAVDKGVFEENGNVYTYLT